MTEFRNGNSEAALVLVGNLPVSPDANANIWYWRARVLRAQLFLRQSQPAQALDFLSRFPTALPDEIAAKKEILAAEALCSIGKVEEADQHLNGAQRFAPVDNPLLQAELLYGRADCASYNHPDAAMQMFAQAVTLAHERDGYLEARSLAYQGYLLMQANYYDKAIELFDRALSLTDSPYLKQTLLGNKGYSMGQLGEWIASGIYLKQAIEIASQVKDAKANRALWLIDLGRQQVSQMEYEDAQQSFRQGLDLANEIKRPDLAGICLINSAVTAMKQGNLLHAKEQIEAAERAQISKESQLLLTLAKARFLRLEGEANASELLLNNVMAARPGDDIKWFAESELAETFVAEKRPTDADRMFQRAIASFERGFERISKEKYKISFLDQDPLYDAYISFLFSQGRELDALNVSERGRSRALAEGRKRHPLGSSLNIRAIQRNLARQGHEIVLAYWLTPKESYLWLISPTEFKTFTLTPEMDIVREIEAYNRATQDQSVNETPQGKNLYKMLVAPATKFIPKDARVIIVPHRRLHKLNFETLVTDGDQPHFWIEDVCIQNTSFLAALENPKSAKPVYPKQLLLMGNPVQATKEFPGLAHAADEMKTVAGRFKPSGETIHARGDATPEAYDASKPAQFRFLHFVTHGTASDLNPLESAIVLSRGKDGFKLYAEDIIKIPIHPELVTISSCYGAGTRQYSGEGLVGLSWAFLRAGSHNVIGALWETDDEANVKLMGTFYKEMSSKDDLAGALRTAKLELLHSNSFWKRPYYWGALQLYSSN